MKTLVKTSEMVKAIVIASLIGSLFVATAAAAAESVDESRPASPEGRIQFAAVTGDFEIIGHDAEEWLLSGTLGDDVKELVIEGGPDDWTIRLEMKKGNSGWNLNKASTDLKLLVPRRSDLDVQTVSGDLWLRELEGRSIDAKSEDAIISDALNHASIIDGIRLCKAERHRYPNSDMNALEEALKKTQDKRTRLIATDGVFSMDGTVAKLDEITQLAEKYDALVMVDDCHATGFFGPTGRGSPEHHGVLEKVDIITSTLGKALGGGMGGFTVARQEVVDILRQRSRPYLFSNSLAPPLVAASIKVFEILNESTALRDKLAENKKFFRKAMTDAGFDIKPGEHPIVPVMLYDAPLAQKMADALLEEGIYVIGFFYPVVPKGEARIRLQISAAHEREHLERAVDAFTRIGKKLGVIE